MIQNMPSAWTMILKALSRDDVSEVEVVSATSVWLVLRGKRVMLKHASWHNPQSKNMQEDINSFFMDFNQVVKPMMHASGFKRIEDEQCIYEGALIFADTDSRGQRQTVHARLHIMLPPACEFPQVTIAKRSESLTSLEVMRDNGTMNQEILDFIKALVVHKQTIVFSAGSGGGKTTMLRACCRYLRPDERIVVCEDSPELTLPIDNVSYLQSMPWRPGIDKNQIISLEYLVAQANRMRPDRIIVGETRSKEFHGFLQAANSGYAGSMTTLHANDPRECLDRMTTLDSEATGSTNKQTTNHNIAYAVDFIIQLGKDNHTGRHWVQQIEEISNIVNSKGEISSATAFKYENGMFVNTINSINDEKLRILGYRR